MKWTEIELPSNRKFGLFFAVVFAIASAYGLYNDASPWGAVFGGLALVFFILGLLQSPILTPFNRGWMAIGFFLGMIVSPIVLGVIFYLVFTPLAFLMRLAGRDELRLRFQAKSSH